MPQGKIWGCIFMGVMVDATVRRNSHIVSVIEHRHTASVASCIVIASHRRETATKGSDR